MTLRKNKEGKLGIHIIELGGKVIIDQFVLTDKATGERRALTAEDLDETSERFDIGDRLCIRKPGEKKSEARFDHTKVVCFDIESGSRPR